jgi:hypothetical protein
MKKVTLAAFYELQGMKEEALEVYKDILMDDPTNKEAKGALRRLSGIRRQFSNVNEEMKDFFINMDSETEFIEFERWLLKLWN